MWPAAAEGIRCRWRLTVARTVADRREHLVETVVNLLRGKGAHATFDEAVDRFPAALRGVKPEGSPHTAWQILEHLRIAQRDILRFSTDPAHVSPAWPEGYWPPGEAPPGGSAWRRSVEAFRADLEAMVELVGSPGTDLLARIPHGSGQTILREALLVADHNAYHVGQFVLLRRLLGAWPAGR
jgi:hypothetical protein